VNGKVTPKLATLKEGMNAYFNCLFSSKPVWTHNRLDLLYNCHLSNNGTKLTVISLSEYNKGFYECTGKLDNGQQFIARGHLKIFSSKFFF